MEIEVIETNDKNFIIISYNHWEIIRMAKKDISKLIELLQEVK